MIYVDTSAFLKLVQDEPESDHLRSFLQQRGPAVRLVSSVLLRVEARRGVLRNGGRRSPRVDLLLGDVDAIALSDAVVESAGRLPDPLLRSLDAIHLATALLVRNDLDVLLTYDHRLAEAARAEGITVAAPS